MSDFEDKAASLVEEMSRRAYESILEQLDTSVLGSADVTTTRLGPESLGRLEALMRQKRDTPELRFKQTGLVPRGQMFQLTETQRDPNTGRAYQLVLIHPEDVPSVRSALLAEMAKDSSPILRPMLPQGLEDPP
jgi:hypothetical protein